METIGITWAPAAGGTFRGERITHTGDAGIWHYGITSRGRVLVWNDGAGEFVEYRSSRRGVVAPVRVPLPAPVVSPADYAHAAAWLVETGADLDATALEDESLRRARMSSARVCDECRMAPATHDAYAAGVHGASVCVACALDLGAAGWGYAGGR